MATGFFGAIKGALFETDPEQAPSGEKTAPPTETVNGAGTVISDAAAPDAMVQGLTDVAMGTPSAYTRLLQAASRLENFIPTVPGPHVRRGGTRFVGEVKGAPASIEIDVDVDSRGTDDEQRALHLPVQRPRQLREGGLLARRVVGLEQAALR